MRRLLIAPLAALLAALALSACGGGGGTTPPISGSPPVTVSPTPVATGTPAVTLQYTGKVLDADHGSVGVAGATVSVGTTWSFVAASSYVLTGTTATTTTAADGTFTIPVAAAATYVQVSAAGLVSAHRPILTAPNQWGFMPPAGTLGTFALPTPNSDELAGLAEINKNRALYGAGQGAQPLTLDADVMLSARAHVQDMAAKGYFAHTEPGETYGFSGHYLCTPLGGFCSNPFYLQENIGANATSLAVADDGYIALGPGEGHHDNVVSKTNNWVGLGAAYNGVAAPDIGGTTANYFAENYITSTANPYP